MDETVRRLILWHQSEIARLSALLPEQDDEVLVYATPNNGLDAEQALSDVEQALSDAEQALSDAEEEGQSQDMFLTQRDPPSDNVFVAFLDTLDSDDEDEGSTH